MKKLCVSIVGIKGGWGSFWKRFFRSHGYTVIGCDIDYGLPLEDLVRRADILVFASSLPVTVSLMKKAAPLLSSSQLVIDITSKKKAPLKAMLHSKADVIGLHPLEGAVPGAKNLEGISLVYCGGRLREWKKWAKWFFPTLNADVLCFEAKKHDEVMMAKQVLLHNSLLAWALTMKDLGLLPTDLFELETRLSRPVSQALARMLLNPKPQIYSDLQMFDPDETIRAESLLVCNHIELQWNIAHKKGQAKVFKTLRDYFTVPILKKMLRG